MKLYFLRHGIAEDAGPGMRDFDRRLTPEGITEMEGVGRGMEALGLELDAILTSPLVRARETAVLAAKALGCEDRVTECRPLASGARFGDLQSVLEGHSQRARVLLVGHEPDFSTFVAYLIGGGAVRMKKASLAYVEAFPISPGAGELRWLLTAEQLCELGGPPVNRSVG